MASISALHHVNISAITAQSHSAQKPSAPSASVIGFIHTASFGSRTGPNKSPLRLPLKALRSRRSSFRVFAANGDVGNERSGEMSSEGAPPSAATAIATAIEEEEESETKDLKRALMDSFYDTERGLTADSKKRAEIVELITQLEAKNPNPAPTEALNLLNGKWILVYTSPELFPLLAAGTLPFVKIKEISQKIDSETLTVQNYIQFAGPLATTSFSTNATFEVCSPKRVQIKIDEGIIATPQLTDSIEIPDSIEFLGQNIDLSSFQGVITSVQNTASSVVRTISEQPPIKFPISSDRAQSWLLTTYLDNDLRISRGDGSSVFVLIKEGGPLMLPS